MEKILSSKGYNVICADNAEKALTILESIPVDLLYSDVIMPGMNGYELASKVSERYPNIKIQIVSGYDEDVKVEENIRFIHEQKLSKPVQSSVLLKRIRSLLDEN